MISGVLPRPAQFQFTVKYDLNYNSNTIQIQFIVPHKTLTIYMKNCAHLLPETVRYLRIAELYRISAVLKLLDSLTS